MNRSARRHLSCAAHETLEARRLLSIAPLPKTGRLNISGTDGDDVISVRAHAHLINAIVIVMKSPDGTERKAITNGRIDRINISAGGGHDRVRVDASLVGLRGDIDASIDLGGGNDVLEACSLDATVRGGGGDDRVDADASAGTLSISGGDGVDRITLSADGKHTVHGDAGNDRINLTATFKDVFGGDGDDRIALDKAKAATSSGYVYGDAGDDTLIGGVNADSIYGGDGEDLLVAGTGSRGDVVNGGAGNDVLDATDSSGVSLYGGDGDDDLYSGRTTVGNGEDGRDWFEPDDGWRRTDYDASEDVRWGDPAKNRSTYSGGGWAITGSHSGSFNNGWVSQPEEIRLRRLDDLGFVAVRTTKISGSGSNDPGVIKSLGRAITGDADYRTAAPPLTAAERKSVRPGLLRLAKGWTVGNPRPSSDGSLVWLDVRGNGIAGGSLSGRSASSVALIPSSAVWIDAIGGYVYPPAQTIVATNPADQIVPGRNLEFGTVYQLCVRRDTLIVTDGSDVADDRIRRARADKLGAMRLPDGAAIRIAGSATAYTIASSVPDELLGLTAPAGRRGVLVEGGILWLTQGDQASAFIAR